MSNNSNFELPQEFLELISGGNMTEADKETIARTVRSAKACGTSKSLMIDLVRGYASWHPSFNSPTGSGLTVDEYIGYVEEIWDTI